MSVHFMTKKDLLRWLEQNCTRKAVVRALQEGTVEHLGAFTMLGPWKNPGFIVKVTSETERVWIVEVVSSYNRWAVYIQGFEGYIPWRYWSGTADSISMPLHDGDNPIKYARLRDKQIEKENDVTNTPS